MAKLTEKQRVFVDEYLVDMNATQAAIRTGYSEATAYSQGQRLLKNVEVSAAIAAAMRERSERTKVDADWLLTRLATEADADLAELYDSNGHLRPVHDWPLIWRQGLVAGVETVRERTGKDEAGQSEYSTVHKLKLSDRTRRLELIGKHVDVQAFRDRVEHCGRLEHEFLPAATEEEARRNVAEWMREKGWKLVQTAQDDSAGGVQDPSAD